jgi:hypothetical protein
MNSPYEQPFADFEALLSTWKDAHICSVHSYVAVKGPEGNRLLFGRILLEPTRDGVNDTPFQFETEHIIAGRFVKVTTPESITGFIAKAKTGQMDTDKGIVSIVTDSSRSISGYFAPIYHPLISDGPRLPSLIVHGTPKHNVLVTVGDSRQFDWEMKAADAPFDSLDANWRLHNAGDSGKDTCGSWSNLGHYWERSCHRVSGSQSARPRQTSPWL